MKKIIYQHPIFLIVTMMTLLLSGCSQLGPDFMENGRNEYNKVLANTNDEEMLLNLVRRRYADSIAILEVNSVSTSLEWKRSGGLIANIFEGTDNDNLGIRSDGSYSEKPTITYLPLQGSDYVRNVLSPIQPEIILLLTRSGWSIERLLRLTANKINGINNASEASGPTPAFEPTFKEFKELANIFYQLQQKNIISFGYQDEGENNNLALLIRQNYSKSKEVKSLMAALKLDTPKAIIPLTTDFSSGTEGENIEINLRSLAGIQFFLSHGVLIPPDDITNNRVKVTKTKNGQNFNWQNILSDLFVVYSQTENPTNASVKVKYRGNWFFIKDNDMESKYTLMLLNQISALQSGNLEKVGPVLTLPLSQ
tara:strand:- start:73 stop:1173 length:1101 start_codon:yes stop_codon:yes gene_type:complete